MGKKNKISKVERLEDKNNSVLLSKFTKLNGLKNKKRKPIQFLS
jgi:hypothetical protein